MAEQKEDLEIRAIKEIIAAFDLVPKDRKAAVMNYIVQRVGGVDSPVSSQASQQVFTQNIPSNSPQIQSNETLVNFVARKKPFKRHLTVATLAYFMQKRENILEFRPKDIQEASRKARTPKIGGYREAVINAEKLKLLTKGVNDSRCRQLTPFGEEVVEALPDKDKIMNLLRTHMKKPGPKRKKGKKSN